MAFDFVTLAFFLSMFHFVAVYICAVVLKAPYMVTWFASVLSSGFTFILFRRFNPEWRATLYQALHAQNRSAALKELFLGGLLYFASSLACFTVIYQTYGRYGLVFSMGTNAIVSTVI
jgi:hypothetical protein